MVNAVLVSNLMMPGMNGLEVCQALHPERILSGRLKIAFAIFLAAQLNRLNTEML